MVAGALKNPWVHPGRSVRLDDTFFAKHPGGCEVEACFGDTSGFPPKIPANDPEDDPDADYLYVEELPEAPGDKMGKVRPDLKLLKENSFTGDSLVYPCRDPTSSRPRVGRRRRRGQRLRVEAGARPRGRRAETLGVPLRLPQALRERAGAPAARGRVLREVARPATAEGRRRQTQKYERKKKNSVRIP